MRRLARRFATVTALLSGFLLPGGAGAGTGGAGAGGYRGTEFSACGIWGERTELVDRRG